MGNQMPDRQNTEKEHAWVEERLSAYIDDQLAPLERAHLERHLRGCDRCQASLASLRWTVSLVKQAPAPALPRTFTLPMPAQTRRAPAFGFGFARLATVVVTLLLFAVVGVDVISQLGGGFAASAPAPAAQSQAANPTSIALAPTLSQAKEAAPSPAIEMQPVSPTAAPQPTRTAERAALPPAPAAAPPVLPTGQLGLGGGAEETSTADSAKSAVATLAPPRAPGFTARGSITATPVSPTPTPLPTATASIPPPTATALPSPTPIAQAFAQPTVASLPRQVETPRQIVTPVRAAEVGLFFFAVFFGALTILLWRKK